MANTSNMMAAALHYLKLGYRPIALATGTKRARIRWKEIQERVPTEAELRTWFSEKKSNIALVTGNGVVVVDVDDAALLNDVLHHCGETTMRTHTPCGIHLWYRMRRGVTYGNAVKIKGRNLDLRCEGAYVVVPPSVNAEGVGYRWLGPVLPAKQLPLMKVGWLRERAFKLRVQPLALADELEGIGRRARAYLAKIPGAISGQRGHDRTMRVAGVLVQKFGLTILQAWPIFSEWNEQCEPPWSEKELLHKLQDAERLKPKYARLSLPRG